MGVWDKEKQTKKNARYPKWSGSVPFGITIFAPFPFPVVDFPFLASSPNYRKHGQQTITWL